MESVPEFSEAVESFRKFLATNSLPTDITWVFRDDTWFVAYGRLLVRSQPSSRSPELAAKVYSEGRARGLVEILAIGRGHSHTFATVWFPKFTEDEVQGWNVGLKLSVRQPCPLARAVGSVAWALVRWSPVFRKYQREYTFIGSLAWAAA
jgi:hypothetical protein